MKSEMNVSATGVITKPVLLVHVFNHLEDLSAGGAPADVPWPTKGLGQHK